MPNTEQLSEFLESNFVSLYNPEFSIYLTTNLGVDATLAVRQVYAISKTGNKTEKTGAIFKLEKPIVTFEYDSSTNILTATADTWTNSAPDLKWQLKSPTLTKTISATKYYNSSTGKYKVQLTNASVYSEVIQNAIRNGEIVMSLDAIQDPVSLQEPVYNDGDDSIYIMDQVKDNKNTDEKWVENLTIAQALNKLNKREKEIIGRRFFDGRTQMEVAEEIGISQAQVSRIEKGAINRIRKAYR